MNDCDKTAELLVLYAEGALEAPQSDAVRAHLALCSRCREEAGAIGQIREYLMDPELFSPDPNYVWQLLPRTVAARAAKVHSAKWWLPANLGSLGWTMSLAAMTILAFGSIWLLNRPAPQPEIAAASAAPGNAAFLGKMQIVYAREATAQYLSDCQDLLLTVMRAEKNCQGENYDVSLQVERARLLLQRKQLLNSELRSPHVARAKSLCDELENFLVNLSTSDRCESPEKMRRMESYIQTEQLLLRINLLQSELS